MSGKRAGGRRKPSVAVHHTEWIRLLEVSGPFLELPVLQQLFPQGLEPLDPGFRAGVRQRFEEWLEDGRRDPGIHGQWIRHVLGDVLEFSDEVLIDRARAGVRFHVHLPQHRAHVGPDFVVVDPDGDERARLLIQAYPPEQGLRRPVSGETWKASPTERMVELLRAQQPPVRLGLVTNGEEWTLVHVQPREATSFVTWQAEIWGMEPLTLQAFRMLLGVERTVGSAEEDRLEALFERSAATAHELTDQLGIQVRQAIERLIARIDELDRASGRELLAGYDEKQLYQAAVTVMMRLVFLFYAEENGLLPLDDPFYQENYAVSPLRDQLTADLDRLTDDVLHRRYAAWCRLLATFRAVHGGVEHEAMRLPAYGGSLFDPDRYPFLEGRGSTSRWRDTPADPLRIDDLTVLHLLESLQLVEVAGGSKGKREKRPLSFRSLDVEQIGHVYEGLLDHTAVRATGPVLGLVGKLGEEPEVELGELERVAERSGRELLDYVAESTGKTEKALQKLRGLEPLKEDPDRWSRACAGDRELLERLAPFAGFVREEHGMPVVFPAGAVYVTKGTDRRSTGTHYTPRSLTEPIVRYALEPLVYEGPAEGKPESEWRLRSPREILALKVCDMTVGSGAFLVQACRYLAERLVESWAEQEQAHEGKVLVSPEGDLEATAVAQRPMPRDDEERLAIARRAVVDRCLYGVDVNEMAVEMAKLSLWLVTLQKDRPFTFLDHSIRCGDSLLGVHDPEQLAWFHLDPERGQVIHKWAGGVQKEARRALAQAAELRTELESFMVLDVQHARHKAKLLARSRDLVADLRLAADLLVGAALNTVGENQPEIDERAEWIGRDVAQLLAPELDEASRSALRAQLVLERNRQLRGADGASIRPFHWALEFPELMDRRRCVLGNPPYIGNKYWKSRLTIQQQRSVQLILGPNPGKVDLWVAFLRRAATLLSEGSCLALLGPSSAAEGEAVKVGLGPVSETLNLYRAMSSFPWPGTATTYAIAVWARRSDRGAGPILDGAPAVHIAGDLSDRPPEEPQRLPNQDGWFEGVHNARGLALVMTVDAPAYRELQRANSPYLRPYVTGDDITSRPPDVIPRWCVDCGDDTLDQVESNCKVTHEFLLRHVLPTRTPAKLRSYKGLADRWWQFWNTRAPNFRKLRESSVCLAIPNVAKHVVCVERDAANTYTNQVYLHKVTGSLCAVIHSSVFQDWVEAWSGTMGAGVRVKLTRAVRTFPLPYRACQPKSSWPTEASAWCREQRAGYTDLFNRICDPGNRERRIEMLRSALADADSAALSAYGWSDLVIRHDFVRTRFGIRFRLASELRAEVMSRLLELNRRQAPATCAPASERRSTTTPSLFDKRYD